MPINQVLKEIKKAKRNNTLEIDPLAALLEVVDELIAVRKDLDELATKIAALEGTP